AVVVYGAGREGRFAGRPFAAERAAADETAAQAGVPRVSRYEPRRDSAARIRQKRRHGDRPGRADTVLALVGECCAVASLLCAAHVTAEIAAGPTEGRNHRRRLPHGRSAAVAELIAASAARGTHPSKSCFMWSPPYKKRCQVYHFTLAQ